MVPHVVDVLVNLVGEYKEVFVFEDDVGQGTQLLLAVDRACGVAGRAEDDHAGFGGDGCFQLFGSHLEVLLEGGLYDDRITTGELHHLRVAHPVWCRYNHLLAVVHQCHDGVGNALLGTV